MEWQIILDLRTPCCSTYELLHFNCQTGSLLSIKCCPSIYLIAVNNGYLNIHFLVITLSDFWSRWLILLFYGLFEIGCSQRALQPHPHRLVLAKFCLLQPRSSSSFRINTTQLALARSKWRRSGLGMDGEKSRNGYIPRIKTKAMLPTSFTWRKPQTIKRGMK